jgi:hypothetical protein
VLIGLAGDPSTVDTRDIVLKDVTVVGILGASAGLPGAITAYADGSVDPAPLVATTVGLDEVARVLADAAAGLRTAGGPKIHVDPALPAVPAASTIPAVANVSASRAVSKLSEPPHLRKDDHE